MGLRVAYSITTLHSSAETTNDCTTSLATVDIKLSPLLMASCNSPPTTVFTALASCSSPYCCLLVHHLQPPFHLHLSFHIYVALNTPIACSPIARSSFRTRSGARTCEVPPRTPDTPTPVAPLALIASSTPRTRYTCRLQR